MLIRAYSSYSYQKLEKQNFTPVFGNKISIPATKANKFLERIINKIDLKIRRFANKKRAKKIIEDFSKTNQKLSGINSDMPEFIIYLYKYARRLGANREVEINIESHRLLDIVHSDESCIFIINHSNQKQDPKMLGLLNSLLYGAYIKAEKTASCPRPKVLLNENILLSMDKSRKEMYEKFGAIGIDASFFCTDKGKNSRIIAPLVKDLYNNKSHLFVFPEGKLSFLNDLDLKYKFQTGIAEIVKLLTNKKERVKVIPVGFAYNEKSESFLGSVYIGKPVLFKKSDKLMQVSTGNIDENASEVYKKFFKGKANKDYSIITKEGKPVTGKNISDYIAGILCENLKICTQKAKVMVPESTCK